MNSNDMRFLSLQYKELPYETRNLSWKLEKITKDLPSVPCVFQVVMLPFTLEQATSINTQHILVLQTSQTGNLNDYLNNSSRWEELNMLAHNHGTHVYYTVEENQKERERIKNLLQNYFPQMTAK